MRTRVLRRMDDTATRRLGRGLDRGREVLRDSGDWIGERARSARKRAGKRVRLLVPAGRRRVERRRRLAWFVGGSAVGGALAMLFDPVRGRARRARLASQAGGMLRRGIRRTTRSGRRVVSDVQGWTEAAVHGREQTLPPDDATLAHKVESEVFGRSDVPKGSINVSAAGGVVELRGQVDRPEQVREIERLVRRVPGVLDVDNYLHVPGTPPPNKAAALRASSRSGPGTAIE